MFKVVAQMYLNDEKVVILMDDDQENLYKFYPEIMRAEMYCSYDCQDEFIDDLSVAEGIMIDSDLYYDIVNFMVENIDDDFYKERHQIIINRFDKELI